MLAFNPFLRRQNSFESKANKTLLLVLLDEFYRIISRVSSRFTDTPLIRPFHRQIFFPFHRQKNITQSEFYWRNSAFGRERNKVSNDDNIQHFSKRMISSVQRLAKVRKELLISGRDYS